MKTLIKGAQVVCPDEIVQVDVLIEDTQIAALDPASQSRVDQVIDAAGLALLPGVIDDQVHFREPGLTHKEDLAHATRACAKGGITSFLEMPNTIPTTTSQDRLLAKLELARQQCRVNYGFYIGATPSNIEALKQADRTCGIKIFIGSSTGELLVDDQDALEKIFAETTLPIAAHCEDESTILANQEQWSDSNDVATHSKIRDHRAAIVATRCRPWHSLIAATRCRTGVEDVLRRHLTAGDVLARGVVALEADLADAVVVTVGHEECDAIR